MTALTPLRAWFPFTRSPWWEDAEGLWRRAIADDAASVWSPHVDVLDQPGAYLVKAEVPGLKADEIQIDCTGDTLTLHGQRRQEEKREGEHFRVLERSYGAFPRTVTFPAAVDAEHVEAELKDGVLTIRVMKAKGARAAKIKVREAK